MSSSKLTVVTITYKDLGGLKRTVSSVKQQQAVDIEHIIVNGNGRDEATTYIERNHPSALLIAEVDRGRYDAMNKGFCASSGDYIWFMHSGDVFSTRQSASVGVAALEMRDAEWGFGLSRVIRDGEVVSIGGRIPFSRVRFLSGWDIIPHQASLVRSSFFATLGTFKLDTGLAEDQQFFMRALNCSKPLVIPEFLCDFDGAGAGSIRAPRKHFKDIARARRSEGIQIFRGRILDRLVGPVATVVKATTDIVSRGKR